jgi:hypothetical protein
VSGPQSLCLSRSRETFESWLGRESNRACFLQHFGGAFPGRCGLLAETLDRVTAKKVRSRRILFKSGSCDQQQRIQGIGD